jgi:TM2 domain-containing membrane protein YozV
MASEWYYSHDGERHGPVSTDELKELAAGGKLGPDDLVWKDGMDNWIPAGKVKNLLPHAGGPALAPARAPARVANMEHLPVAGMPADISNRKLAAGLTAVWGGAIGIHKFILGQTTPALIMLLVTLLTFGIGAGVMVIIGMVEGVKYLRMSDEEFYETYIVNRKAWF